MFLKSVHMYLQTAKPIDNVIVFLGRPVAGPGRLAWPEPQTDKQSIIHECISQPKLGKENEQL